MIDEDLINPAITIVLTVFGFVAIIVKFVNGKIAQGIFFIIVLGLIWGLSLIVYLIRNDYVDYKEDDYPSYSSSSSSSYRSESSHSTTSYRPSISSTTQSRTSSELIYKNDFDIGKRTRKMYVDDDGFRRYSDSDKLFHYWMEEKKLGRRLRDGERVVHRNKNKLDNRKSNLKIIRDTRPYNEFIAEYYDQPQPPKTYIDENGYRRFTGNKKAIHRWIAEKKIGRPLRKDEIVHHKNRNKLDNDPDNLEIMHVDVHYRLHKKHIDKKNREKKYNY